jgi:hypothetical protein
VTEAEVIPKRFALVAQRQARLPGIEAAVARADFTRGSSCRATREDLDHAAHRVGAVGRGPRPAHHLHALDLIHRDELPGRAPGRGGTRADAVDQHDHLVGVAPAQEHARLLAETTAAADLHTGQAAQQRGNVRRLPALDVFPGHDRHRVQGFVDRLRHAHRRGDDDRVEPLHGLNRPGHGQDREDRKAQGRGLERRKAVLHGCPPQAIDTAGRAGRKDRLAAQAAAAIRPDSPPRSGCNLSCWSILQHARGTAAS